MASSATINPMPSNHPVTDEVGRVTLPWLQFWQQQFAAGLVAQYSVGSVDSNVLMGRVFGDKQVDQSALFGNDQGILGSQIFGA